MADDPSLLTFNSSLIAEGDVKFMYRALELARRAEQDGEVPVGALVVLEGQVIGEGWNHPIGAADPTAHAEIVALRVAASKLGNYRLTGSTLYVTLEPCPMCAGAIVLARVARVVFGASDPLIGAGGTMFDLLRSPKLNHRAEVQSGVLAEECSRLLKDFFQSKRGQ